MTKEMQKIINKNESKKRIISLIIFLGALILFFILYSSGYINSSYMGPTKKFDSKNAGYGGEYSDHISFNYPEEWIINFSNLPPIIISKFNIV